MKRKKSVNLVLILFLMFAITGCYTFFLIRPRAFTYLYDGKDTGLDTLLNIDGVFYEELDNDSYRGIMFYRDGTVYMSSFVYNDPKELVEKESKNESINKSKGLSRIGNYKMSGDTIKAEIIYYHDFDAAWIYDYWYKIIDRNTLSVVYVYAVSGKALIPESMNKTLHFLPSENRIDSAHWMKNKKWFHTKKK